MGPVEIIIEAIRELARAGRLSEETQVALDALVDLEHEADDIEGDGIDDQGDNDQGDNAGSTPNPPETAAKTAAKTTQEKKT